MLMNYKKIYHDLIITRKTLDRTKSDQVYYEWHHIIPRCIGGTNSKNNLILLTAREHYLAHWLLHRIRPHSTKLSHAFWMMNFYNKKSKEKKYSISARAYSESKEAMAKANAKLNTGKKVKPEHLVAWKRNKNNSKKVINIKTGEIYLNAKQVWKEKYSDYIGYAAFNLYVNKSFNFKNNSKNRKVFDNTIYDWEYITGNTK